MSSRTNLFIDALTRRGFIELAVRQAIVGSSMLSLSPALSASTGTGLPDSEQVLSKLARDLFPHDDFPADIYTKVARALATSMSESEQNKNLLNEALTKMQDWSEVDDWTTLSYAKRLQLLEQLQAEPVFRLLLGTAVRVIYQDPEIWKIIGYGGSAIEHGGYRHRGFDDIDWLPEQ